MGVNGEDGLMTCRTASQRCSHKLAQRVGD